MQSKTDTNSSKEIVYNQIPYSDDARIKSTPRTPRNYFLYFAAIIACLIVMVSGVTFSWTSPVLPQLDAKIGRVTTAAEKSWITGLLFIGCTLGPLGAGRIADLIGRKKGLLLTACPMMVSFLIAAFAKTVPLFYLARFLMGVASGSTFTIIPLYLIEISENHNRGTISSFRTILCVAGILSSYVFGPFLSITNFCLISLVPLLIFVVVFWIWIPETPQYLASQNDQKRLRKSLAQLRMRSEDEVEEELIQINSIPKGSTDKGRMRYLLNTKATRKGLGLTIFLIIWEQFGGMAAIDSYLQTIFEESGSKVPPESSAIIVASVRLICVFFGALIIDRVDRRTLLLISSCGACTSLFCLGIYFHLKSSSFNVDSIFWVPLLSLTIYSISYSSGIFLLPLTIAAEMFPINVKATALTIALLVRSVGGFIVAWSFPRLVIALGNAPTFCIFGFVSFALGTIIFLVLPETRGKSLQEIQDLLEPKKNKNPSPNKFITVT